MGAHARLAERAFAHELRSADRARPATIAALALSVVAFLTLVPLLVPQARTPWVSRRARPVVAWVRYLQRIRPRFR